MLCVHMPGICACAYLTSVNQALLAKCSILTANYVYLFFSSLYGQSAKCIDHENKRKNEDPLLAIRTEQTMLVKINVYYIALLIILGKKQNHLVC